MSNLYSGIEHFRAAVFRFTLKAGERGLVLPDFKGSTLRGGLGHALRRVVCVQRGAECDQCIMGNHCAYSYIFETSPRGNADFYSKFSDVPRPFVIEPPESERNEYSPDDKVRFNLILFGRALQYLPHLIVAVVELGKMGLGRGRRPFTLELVEVVDPFDSSENTVYTSETESISEQYPVVSGSDILDYVVGLRGRQLVISFQTMTRLKHQGSLTDEPSFEIIIRALLRRLTAIMAFHCGYELQWDFASLIERARTVELLREDVNWRDWTRYSSRQRERMKLGGIIGNAVYCGPFQEFLPLLKFGEIIHIGKNAVFGLGKYQVSLR